MLSPRAKPRRAASAGSGKDCVRQDANAYQTAAVLESVPLAELVRDVVEGLTGDPKRIPSRYLYDDLGSRLFEAICELPWYRITRGEGALLRAHAGAIFADLGARLTVIELGAGNGEKLSLLLQTSGIQMDQADVHVVDIAATALLRSRQTLSQHDGIHITTHEARYEVGLLAARAQANGAEPAVVLFLGSNIGNMSRAQSDEFLGLMRRGCRVGDRLLLGTDLVKPTEELLLAYDDPLGISAAFNRNLLVRLNRELDGDFDLAGFDHHVLWNPDASRVESYLVSRAEQQVCLRAADCCTSFAEHETIWTESSQKYEPEEVVAMGHRAAFSVRHQWVEPDVKFALTLFEARGD